jgi:hypothetical protein
MVHQFVGSGRAFSDEMPEAAAVGPGALSDAVEASVDAQPGVDSDLFGGRSRSLRLVTVVGAADGSRAGRRTTKPTCWSTKEHTAIEVVS